MHRRSTSPGTSRPGRGLEEPSRIQPHRAL